VLLNVSKFCADIHLKLKQMYYRLLRSWVRSCSFNATGSCYCESALLLYWRGSVFPQTDAL